MSRAWPFEGKSEGVDKVRSPQDFLARYGAEGSEAVVIRIGLNDAQLVLVDGRGYWERWVYHSMGEAEAEAAALGIPVHTGEYPEATRVRIGKYQPDAEHFEKAAYPEEGGIGPVNQYPENRSRDVLVETSQAKKQASPEK
jgi:hypothetical protein